MKFIPWQEKTATGRLAMTSSVTANLLLRVGVQQSIRSADQHFMPAYHLQEDKMGKHSYILFQCLLLIEMICDI